MRQLCWTSRCIPEVWAYCENIERDERQISIGRLRFWPAFAERQMTSEALKRSAGPYRAFKRSVFSRASSSSMPCFPAKYICTTVHICGSYEQEGCQEQWFQYNALRSSNTDSGLTRINHRRGFELGTYESKYFFTMIVMQRRRCVYESLTQYQLQYR